MSSHTYNCIGYGPEIKLEDGTIRRRVYVAMSRLDIFQEQAKARKYGEEIEHWEAQTRTGYRILGDPAGYVKTEKLKSPVGMIPCICPGARGCQACNWSGLTTKKHLSGYRDWQLEEFRKEQKPWAEVIQEGKESFEKHNQVGASWK